MLQVLLVFAPLVGAIAAGLFGRQMGDRNTFWVTCGLMGVTALCAWINLFLNLGEPAFQVRIFSWIHVGSFEADWRLRVDSLSTVMMLVVGFISFLIHVYSVGYMAHDGSKPRFMSYLSLFTFFMLMLVTSDDIIQLFFGWEGVGLASYLLIGFWYTRASACNAAMKAFIVNRVGDFAFMLGIAAIWLVFDSVQYDTIFAALPKFAESDITLFGGTFHTLTIIGFLLFFGAMGKSAQLGLHTWLPDAMEGPTPVSALIHAATMVTAGVFLVARFSPLYELAPTALAFITFIGGSTALFAATIGITQFDIKRVIAYSTCSQLGYMFFAEGVGAYSAGIFHLMTHAFFKALLFLSAGSVIHAMSDEQDMRRMGGIWSRIKITYVVMWIGSLALIGFPGFAGYFSKDAIIEAAYASGNSWHLYAFWMGVIAAGLTAFLFRPADLADLPRQAARRPPHDGARPREPAGHDHPAHGAGGRGRARRLARPGADRTRPPSLGRGDRHRPGQPRPRRDGGGADLGEVLAVRRHADRPRLLVGRLHRSARSRRQDRARCRPGEHVSCSTNGISTSSTTGSSSARRAPWA